MSRTRARSVVASTTPPDSPPGAVIANGQLLAIVEGIEKLEEERNAKSADIRQMYAEAKGQGCNVKALRGVVRERRQDAGERAELEATMDAAVSSGGDTSKIRDELSKSLLFWSQHALIEVVEVA